MPIFDYECESCDEIFSDVLIRNDKDKETWETCPECGGVLHKLPSRVGAEFKGKGFYKTDYNNR